MKHKREGGGDEPVAGEEPAAAPAAAGGVARAKSPTYDPINDAHVYGPEAVEAVSGRADGLSRNTRTHVSRGVLAHTEEKMVDAAKEVVGECVS